MLDDVHYKSIDHEIERIVIQNKKLADCKSLDAIHLATALYFTRNSKQQNIILCSFDNNMLELAKQLGFEIRGNV